MFDWSRVIAALDGKREPAHFWWRDDDAGEDDARLQRLLDLSMETEQPLCLAVVPSWLTVSAASQISNTPRVTVAQHGWSHENHAAVGQKSIELGGRADDTKLAGALLAGRTKLREHFGSLYSDMMVPPWNRISPSWTDWLRTHNYRAISVMDDRHAPTSTEEFRSVPVHIDPVDWHGHRGLLDHQLLVDTLLRVITSPPRTPIGLMTHYQIDDPMKWQWVRELLNVIRAHPKAAILSVPDVLCASRDG